VKKYEKIIIVLIIGAVIIGYGYMNNKAKDKRTILNQSSVLNCQHNCEVDYSEVWDSSCKARKLGENCWLPGNIADDISSIRTFCQSNCIKTFGN